VIGYKLIILYQRAYVFIKRAPSLAKRWNKQSIKHNHGDLKFKNNVNQLLKLLSKTDLH